MKRSLIIASLVFASFYAQSSHSAHNSQQSQLSSPHAARQSWTTMALLQQASPRQEQRSIPFSQAPAQQPALFTPAVPQQVSTPVQRTQDEIDRDNFYADPSSVLLPEVPVAQPAPLPPVAQPAPVVLQPAESWTTKFGNFVASKRGMATIAAISLLGGFAVGSEKQWRLFSRLGTGLFRSASIPSETTQVIRLSWFARSWGWIKGLLIR